MSLSVLHFLHAFVVVIHATFYAYLYTELEPNVAIEIVIVVREAQILI